MSYQETNDVEKIRNLKAKLLITKGILEQTKDIKDVLWDYVSEKDIPEITERLNKLKRGA
tara:strand:+ start:613 stop:792 length:180 start_codon:yes stop_codon:yes gene_type:complete